MRWMKVDAAHGIEGSREEWRLEDGATLRARAMESEDGEGYDYVAYRNGSVAMAGWGFDCEDTKRMAELAARCIAEEDQ